MKNEVKIIPVKGEFDLFLQYANQQAPQDCFIALDENGNVWADVNAEIGNGVPADVWHGRTRRYYLPGPIRGSSVNDFMNDNKELFQVIYNGLTITWDGSNYNGKLDEDAQEEEENLMYGIDSYFYEEDYLRIWTIDEWMNDCPPKDLEEYYGIKARMTEDEVTNTATLIETNALQEIDKLTGDIEEWVRGKSKGMEDKEEEDYE